VRSAVQDVVEIETFLAGLQHHRAAVEAAIEFFERIGARGMNRGAREKFGMLASQASVACSAARVPGPIPPPVAT
jgi:hypothetical protein